MNTLATSGSEDRPSGQFDRSQVAKLAGVAILGALWGAAWQRSAALSDIAAVAPIMLVVIGPGLLVAYILVKLLTGGLEARTIGPVVAVAVVGALVGNQLTPGLAPSAQVPGRMTGTLDGAQVNGAATCTWGPGQAAVLRVATSLPELIPPPAGQTGGSFTQNIPTGTLTIELPSGSVGLTDIPPSFGVAALPLRNGSGNVGDGSRATGSITLDTSQRATVNGQLSWTCDSAPAP